MADMGAIREQLKQLPIVLAFFALGLGFTFAPSITLGAIAAVFFVMAVGCIVQDRRLARVGQRAQGVVVGHRQKEGCFFPMIEFQDRAGCTRREATKLGRGVKKPPVGRHVTIIYDPTGKDGCEIDRFWRRKGFTVALWFFGVIFAIGALLSR